MEVLVNLTIEKTKMIMKVENGTQPQERVEVLRKGRLDVGYRTCIIEGNR